MKHMVAAIRQSLTITSSGTLQVHAPELKPGDRAEVIVLIEPSAAESALTPMQALDALQKSLNLTPEAAEAWSKTARQERQSFGSRE